MITCSFDTLSITPNKFSEHLFPSHSHLHHRKCFLYYSTTTTAIHNLTTKSYASRNNHHPKLKNSGEEEVEEEEEELDRDVNWQVDVISWRERRIHAEICVQADIDSVWNALTDYERLADFIPNLVCSGRIPCPHPGRIWLEQRGLQRGLYWHIEARVVLDLREFLNSGNERELHFSMVDGDFKKFEGKWLVKSGPSLAATTLSYELNVLPRFNFPTIFLERIIKSDLPVNLRALACRAERTYLGNHKVTEVESSASAPIYASPGIDLNNALSEEDKLPYVEPTETISSSNMGSSSSSDVNSKWGVFGKVCRLDKPCMVDEVHFRRFDGLLENGGVHRCVVASITVKAPVREVWNVLTAYERLPEIVPNLAISRILSRENNEVRILQEGCKGLLYMVLHARVVLDIREHLEQEIIFEQVEGDFDSFQGKWILEQLGSHHTLLKYTVESKMQQNSLLSEAIMEEVIYEDLPSNLCAIRDYVEKKEAENHPETCDDIQYFEEPATSSDSDSEATCAEIEQPFCSYGPHSVKQRPRVPGLQTDIEILKSEILKFISEHGQEGFMPMRKQLRLHGRVDIEKAITRMGGFRKMASVMNLSLAYKHRKPKGYWDNLEHLQEEICKFQRSWGMDPSVMPSRKSFERAGRFDIARALEKWGGLHEVSRLLSLTVRPNRRATAGKDKKVDYVKSTDVASEKKIHYKSFISHDAHKWAMKMKDLDTSWVQ